VQAAKSGDALACEVVEEAGYWVGVGIVNLVNVLNPQMVVVGGGIAQAGDILFDPIRRTVKSRAIPWAVDACRIVPAMLGDDAGIVGAAVQARDEG